MRSLKLFICANGSWLCVCLYQQHNYLLKKCRVCNQGHTFPQFPHPLLSIGSIGVSLVAFETLAADYLLEIDKTQRRRRQPLKNT